MDTSETYIKMCDCEEIQGILWENGGKRHRRNEDILACPIHLKPYEHLPLGSYRCFGNRCQSNRSIWLPRQDQLQEMIPLIVEGQTGYPEVSAAVLDKFLTFMWDGFYKSMEQLWLAFVMKEKYNKIWDGENWINDTH